MTEMNFSCGFLFAELHVDGSVYEIVPDVYNDFVDSETTYNHEALALSVVNFMFTWLCFITQTRETIKIKNQRHWKNNFFLTRYLIRCISVEQQQ